MTSIKSQEKKYADFYNNLKRELDLALEDATVEKTLKIKIVIERTINIGRDTTYKFSPLLGENITNLLVPYEQGHRETDRQYLARTKIPQNIAVELCLANLRGKQKDIDAIIESSDRVKKITLFLIAHNYPNSGHILEPGDLKNSASVNRKLRELLVKSTPKELKYYESFQPYYSALFEDHRFLYFIEKTKVPNYLYTYLCIFKSITPLDLFRIETEITYKKDLKKRNQVFKNTIAEFEYHEKKLNGINRSLAKLKNPLYAELKEYIINAGFSINKNTGAKILLSTAETADTAETVETVETVETANTIIKKIRTIEKRVEQREFRKKDAYTQINFNVYTFPDNYPHRNDFNRNKSALINKLISKFLAIGTKHINTAIASNKNLPCKKSSTKLTIRVPKKAHLKIKNLAKQHKITQELLVNIIIQDDKNNYTRFIEITSNQQKVTHTQAQDDPCENNHLQSKQPLQIAAATTGEAQLPAEQAAMDSDNESQLLSSQEKQTPNAPIGDKPSLGKIHNAKGRRKRIYVNIKKTPNQIATEAQPPAEQVAMDPDNENQPLPSPKKTDLSQALEELNLVLGNKRREE